MAFYKWCCTSSNIFWKSFLIRLYICARLIVFNRYNSCWHLVIMALGVFVLIQLKRLTSTTPLLPSSVVLFSKVITVLKLACILSAWFLYNLVHMYLVFHLCDSGTIYLSTILFLKVLVFPVFLLLKTTPQVNTLFHASLSTLMWIF